MVFNKNEDCVYTCPFFQTTQEGSKTTELINIYKNASHKTVFVCAKQRFLPKRPHEVDVMIRCLLAAVVLLNRGGGLDWCGSGDWTDSGGEGCWGSADSWGAGSNWSGGG